MKTKYLWEQRKLGDFSTKVSSKNIDGVYSNTLTNSAEYGIIDQNDYFDKSISNPDNIKGYYIVHLDDFVYNPRISNLAPCGPIKRNKQYKTGIMSPLYTVFKVRDVDKSFLEVYFETDNWHPFMRFHGDTGARSDRFAIKDKSFFEMPIMLPSGLEQTKISNLFNIIDKAITLHQRYRAPPSSFCVKLSVYVLYPQTRQLVRVLVYESIFTVISDRLIS